MDKSPGSTPHRPATLIALCVGLWLISLMLSTYSLWLLSLPDGTLWALLAMGVAILTTAAGVGLYRMQRWGVVLFGILGAAGSVSHIANAIERFVTLYNADTGSAISGIIRVIGAFLIPFIIIYLVLILWRKTQ